MKNIPMDYLDKHIGSIELLLSKQDAATQQKGLDLIRSGYFLSGHVPQYRRFYVLTGLISQYSNEFNQAYKEKLRDTIKAIYAQEEDSYLREVLSSSFGELLD